jgi:hypothetical protein
MPLIDGPVNRDPGDPDDPSHPTGPDPGGGAPDPTPAPAPTPDPVPAPKPQPPPKLGTKVPNLPKNETPIPVRRHPSDPPKTPPPVPDTPGPGKDPDPTPVKSVPTPIEPQSEHRTYTFTALTDWAVPVIYGPAKVGAGTVYGPVVKTRSDGSAVVSWWLSWGEISSAFNFLIDGQPFSKYYMTLGTDYNVYLGTNSQGVDPIGLAAEPSRWAGKTFAGIDGVTGKNIAYITARFPRPGPGQQAPNLQEFTCEVHGRLVLDPRLGVDGSGIPNQPRVYSDNPALCLADYMTSPWYGAAVPLAQMDWTGTITDTANACDFNIGGGVKRFTIGGMITKRSIDANVDFIRGCAQILKPVYNNGMYQLIMDLPQSPLAITLTDVPGVANIISATDLNIRGSNEVFDRTVVGYTDIAAGYKDNTVPSSAAATTTDPNYVEKRFDFPLIPTGDQASRIANYLQKKSTLCDRSGTIRVNAIGARILPGSMLPVTYTPWGWTTQNALVLNCKSVGTAWDLTVEQWDTNVYSDTFIVVTVATNPVIAAAQSVELAGVVGSGNLLVGSAAGGRALIGPSTQLASNLTAAATSIDVMHNQIVSGDRIYLESAPNGVTQIEHMAVTSAASGTGPYTYSVTRNLDGSGANAWIAGDSVFNMRQTGAGFIDLYATRGLKSASEVGPAIVGNIRNSATYNDWTPRWAVGNLNGLYGYATDIYGAAFGVPTAAWLKIDPTNGIRIGYNTTVNVQIDASGNASFTGAITADSGTIGGWTINPSALIAPSGAALRSGQTSFNTGTGFWLGNDSGTPKFSIGNVSANKYLTWDGTNLKLRAATCYIDNAFGFQVDNPSAFLVANNSSGLIGGFQESGGHAHLFSTGFASITLAPATGAVNISGGSLYVGGTKVVGSQGAAVADATNATDVITQLNALLARARAHGLIAT